MGAIENEPRKKARVDSGGEGEERGAASPSPTADEWLDRPPTLSRETGQSRVANESCIGERRWWCGTFETGWLCLGRFGFGESTVSRVRDVVADHGIVRIIFACDLFGRKGASGLKALCISVCRGTAYTSLFCGTLVPQR